MIDAWEGMPCLPLFPAVEYPCPGCGFVGETPARDMQRGLIHSKIYLSFTCAPWQIHWFFIVAFPRETLEWFVLSLSLGCELTVVVLVVVK